MRPGVEERVVYIVECLAAALATWGATPLLARVAPRWGLLDRPTARSTHVRPTPRVGGLALGLGLIVGLGAAVLRGHAGLDDGAAWIPWLLPAVAFLALGLADDRWRLRPAPKFLAQVGAAVLAVALGLRWEGVALAPFGSLAFGPLTPVLTAVWIVAVVTVVNFMDGLDLITVTGASVVLGAAAGGGAGPGAGLLFAVALAAVLAFGFWNVRPARAFPGDGATHLLGFLVASAACHAPAATPDAHALPWVLASAPLLPAVLDVALGLLAKARRGVPLHAAHNDHLSQRLTKVGYTHAAVALRYGALALAAVVLVGWVAPAAGLLPCLVLGLALLAWHLGGGLRATRGAPWGAPGPAARG